VGEGCTALKKPVGEGKEWLPLVFSRTEAANGVIPFRWSHSPPRLLDPFLGEKALWLIGWLEEEYLVGVVVAARALLDGLWVTGVLRS